MEYNKILFTSATQYWKIIQVYMTLLISAFGFYTRLLDAIHNKALSTRELLPFYVYVAIYRHHIYDMTT